MIGVYDSGSGGLTVLKAIREKAPEADIIYFGDLKNAPYGNKSREELGALTVLGIQKLIDEGATEIVSACNSVSVSIVLPMFEILNIPHANLIEMVGPTVASLKDPANKVLVVATRATIDSGAYQEGFRMVGTQADGLAIPDLVTSIEAGAPEEHMEEMVREAITPMLKHGYSHLVLGCTHYPLVRHIFDKVVAEVERKTLVVDPAYPVADAVVQRFGTEGKGTTRFLVSQKSDVFSHFVRIHLRDAEPNIEIV